MPPVRKSGCVYIMTNKQRKVLYTGVSSDLRGRVWQHRTHFYPICFTARYQCIHLVYYCFYETIGEAIHVEKRIKAGSRADKESLINSMNSSWSDLWESIQDL